MPIGLTPWQAGAAAIALVGADGAEASTGAADAAPLFFPNMFSRGFAAAAMRRLDSAPSAVWPRTPTAPAAGGGTCAIAAEAEHGSA